MAKFLNKKEQVIDFQLTPYGKHKLAVGNLKPVYYSFYDEGIVYDGEYVSLREEKQNEIHERIKKNTQYLEGILSFQGLEKTVPPATYEFGIVDRTHLVLQATLGFSDEDYKMFVEDGIPIDTMISMLQSMDAFYEQDFAMRFDFSEISTEVSTDKLSFQSEIGDAYFDGEEQQAAPAWKIVACQGTISDCSTMDDTTYYPDNGPAGNTDVEYKIPQLNVDLFYRKRVGAPSQTLSEYSIANTIMSTRPFSDGNVIELIKDDLVVYAEEINTLLLTDNFDVEVYEMKDTDPEKYESGFTSVILERKFFEREDPQVVDGLMVRARPQRTMTESTTELTTNGVEYYFDVLTDSQVDSKIACNCMETFNKETYYVDIDFDCPKEMSPLFYDIYGSATVPEICRVPSEASVASGVIPADSIEPCEDE